MKTHFFFWLLIFGFSNLEAKELKIGYFLTPPHVIGTSDSAKPKGIVVDLWEHVAKNAGNSILWIKMPLARVMKELALNRIDASSAFVPTPLRKQRFIFPEAILDMVQPVIVTRRENPLTILSNKADLEGLSIGYFISGVITPWFEKNDIEFELLAGENALERLLVQLSLSRIDAVYWPTSSGVKFDSHRLELNENFKYIRSPMGPYPLKPMFSKSKAGRILADDFDIAFKGVKDKYRIPHEKELYIKGIK